MALFAVGDRPVLSNAVSKLVNATITPALMADVSAVLGEELDPHDDQQASSSMRRHLAKVLLTRCVSTLLGRPDLDARAA
jgi:aerobic carbon-monoxide dehydrogenase medium subunit